MRAPCRSLRAPAGRVCDVRSSSELAARWCIGRWLTIALQVPLRIHPTPFSPAPTHSAPPKPRQPARPPPSNAHRPASRPNPAQPNQPHRPTHPTPHSPPPAHCSSPAPIRHADCVRIRRVYTHPDVSATHARHAPGQQHSSVPGPPSLPALPALPATHALTALLAMPSIPAPAIPGPGSPSDPSSQTPSRRPRRARPEPVEGNHHPGCHTPPNRSSHPCPSYPPSVH